MISHIVIVCPEIKAEKLYPVILKKTKSLNVKILLHERRSGWWQQSPSNYVLIPTVHYKVVAKSSTTLEKASKSLSNFFAQTLLILDI